MSFPRLFLSTLAVCLGACESTPVAAPGWSESTQTTPPVADSGGATTPTADAAPVDGPVDPVDVADVDSGPSTPLDAGSPDATVSADAAGLSDTGTRDAAPAPDPSQSGYCADLPPAQDFAMPGPFGDAMMVPNVGPDGNYTLFRPGGSLGKDGFLHPIVAWGNGIATTPDQYEATLTLVATHGFVIVGCNDTQAERPCLSAGLDWLVEQNTSGDMAGKLDVTRELAVGYSWGGGAAIDTSNRPNIRATASLHGMPPRETNAFADMHSPLLLFTSTGDGFVTPEGYVTPNYEASEVQTFYATLEDDGAGHLYPVDESAVSCAVSLLLGTCEGAREERAPLIAWLRLWACDDEDAKRFFYGDDCTLCKSPWVMPQRKSWP